MYRWVPFWPNTASLQGVVVNNLFIAELALCVLIVGSVLAMMATFVIRYRRGSAASRGELVHKTWHWEIVWTVGTLVAFLVLFGWGAGIYVWLYQAPKGDIEIYAVAKQWMWKFQHPGGQGEIDTLHVPVGKTIRVVLASQDVIHSFYIPEFRIKHDVVPGTNQVVWFTPDKPGTYRIECTQFCGVQHATMIGNVFVMPQAAYAQWLANQGENESLAQQGEALFRTYGCSGCHGANSTVHAPSLDGLYGSLVHLQDGSVRRADEAYIRDCILTPRSFTVAGYPPVMPDFSGQISEGDVMKLIAYIQSLSSRNTRNVDSH
ncbi:MAG TPA: cytochrome c oxidase subunit II [Stellaceae bacterium]|nr:cytochrome c oxidase subunit II [Stellaceae bacterium]